MDKYLIKRKRVVENSSSQSQPEVQSSPNVNSNNIPPEVQSSPNVNSSDVRPPVRSSTAARSSEAMEINLDELESDPFLRKNIFDFGPNNVEKVRRAYIQRGPNQPRDHIFPQTPFGKDKRRFSIKWFNEYGSWLEYSIKADAAYCLCCYLFMSKTFFEGHYSNVTFVSTGMRNWKRGKEKLDEHVEDDSSFEEKRTQAIDLKNRLQTFEFVFILHMMKTILGITNELSQALQRKDQDIVNAMDYVKVSKIRLQELRAEGWDTLFLTVSSFCIKHDISIPNMADQFVERGRPRRNVDIDNTNLRYFCYELFYGVIDFQMAELDNRFDVVNTELLLCMACLDPSNSFSTFDVQKLICFAKFYPYDFTPNELLLLEDQLLNYIGDVKRHPVFVCLKGIGELSQKMVETRKHIGYPLVYNLVKLALLLPVSTATVERAFSAMKIVKSELRNRMGDEFMNNCLVAYIEQEIFQKIDTEEILQYFQNMKSRRMLL